MTPDLATARPFMRCANVARLRELRLEELAADGGNSRKVRIGRRILTVLPDLAEAVEKLFSDPSDAILIRAVTFQRKNESP